MGRPRARRTPCGVSRRDSSQPPRERLADESRELGDLKSNYVNDDETVLFQIELDDSRSVINSDEAAQLVARIRELESELSRLETGMPTDMKTLMHRLDVSDGSGMYLDMEKLVQLGEPFTQSGLLRNGSFRV